MSFSLDNISDDFTRWERRRVSGRKALAVIALGCFVTVVALIVLTQSR